MKTIIQIMGMRSTKYGGIEKYMCSIAKVLNLRKHKLIIIYESKPCSEQYISDLQEYNSKILIIPSQGFAIFKFIFRFSVLLVQEKPDVVHCHFDPGGYFALLISWIFGVKKRFRTIHSMLSTKMHKEVTQLDELNLKTILLRKLMFKLSTRIFCVSDGIRDQFVKMFRFNYKIETLYLGVSENSYNKVDCKVKYHLPQNAVIIACVAFHDDIKGIDILLQALSILKHTFNQKNILLCQIGGGFENKTDELKQLAENLHVSELINWMGQKDNVPEILAAADIYCQPSRSEGISLAIMEASMASLPIVATKVGGIPEAVLENYSGFLVTSEDAGKMAEKLYILISDNNLRIKMGEHARLFAQNNFRIYHQAIKLINSYSLS